MENIFKKLDYGKYKLIQLEYLQWICLKSDWRRGHLSAREWNV